MNEKPNDAYSQLVGIINSYLKKHRKSLKASGYYEVEHRPYLRVKAQLMNYMSMNLMFKAAEAHAKELLKYDPNDHLGIRYELMANYVKTFSYSKARFFFHSDRDYSFDDQILLYIITSLILERDYLAAKRLIKKLYDLKSNYCTLF